MSATVWEFKENNLTANCELLILQMAYLSGTMMLACYRSLGVACKSCTDTSRQINMVPDEQQQQVKRTTEEEEEEE